MQGSLSRAGRVSANLTRARQIAVNLSKQGRLSAVLTQIFPEVSADTLFAGLLSSGSVLARPELRGVLAATVLSDSGSVLAPRLQGQLMAGLLSVPSQLLTPPGWVQDWAAGILLTESELLTPQLQGQLAAALLASASTLQDALMQGSLVAGTLGNSGSTFTGSIEGVLVTGLLASSSSLLAASVSGKLVAGLLSSTSSLLAPTLAAASGGTLVYSSDFTASTDGWSSTNTISLLFNQTIGGESGCLYYTGQGGGFEAVQNFNLVSAGNDYRITGRLYLVAGSTTIRVGDSTTGVFSTFEATVNMWVPFDESPGTWGLNHVRIGADGSPQTFFVKDIQVYLI